MGGVLSNQHTKRKGSLPPVCCALIVDDANPWILEGLSGKIIYRNFRPDPSRLPVAYKVAPVTRGFSIAVTRHRLVTAVWGRAQLHLAFADARLWRHVIITILPTTTTTTTTTTSIDEIATSASISTSASTVSPPTSPMVLSFTADAVLFDPRYRGEIEVQWLTHEASELYRRIQSEIQWRVARNNTRYNNPRGGGGGSGSFDTTGTDDDCSEVTGESNTLHN